MRELGAPEGQYKVVGDRAVLEVLYPTEEEWAAMSNVERDEWWDSILSPGELFDPPPAHPPGDHHLVEQLALWDVA